MDSKQCPRCGETKPLNEFGTRTDRKVPSWICKPCQKKYSAEQYRRHKEKAIARAKAWRENNPDRWAHIHRKSQERGYAYRLWGHARRRAAAKGIPFTIKVEDVQLPEVCPVLGLALDYSVGTKGQAARDNSPSLDRRVPALGYVPGNVLVISYKANKIKSNATPEELARITNFFLGAA